MFLAYDLSNRRTESADNIMFLSRYDRAGLLCRFDYYLTVNGFDGVDIYYTRADALCFESLFGLRSKTNLWLL